MPADEELDGGSERKACVVAIGFAGSRPALGLDESKVAMGQALNAVRLLEIGGDAWMLGDWTIAIGCSNPTDGIDIADALVRDLMGIKVVVETGAPEFGVPLTPQPTTLRFAGTAICKGDRESEQDLLVRALALLEADAERRYGSRWDAW
jgi:hypothetical protein